VYYEIREIITAAEEAGNRFPKFYFTAMVQIYTGAVKFENSAEKSQLAVAFIPRQSEIHASGRYISLLRR
jgi:hypothetical protein